MVIYLEYDVAVVQYIVKKYVRWAFIKSVPSERNVHRFVSTDERVGTDGQTQSSIPAPSHP